jgi:hypothetical protein
MKSNLNRRAARRRRDWRQSKAQNPDHGQFIPRNGAAVKSFLTDLEMTIDFGTVLDAVNTDNLLSGINPIKNAIISNAELAESGQIHRHAHEPTMHHASGIVREPLDFAFHARPDGGVQPGDLRVGGSAYFDLVGHGWWRGFQGLNLPATSSRRAARNSAMRPGFCAVSQS